MADSALAASCSFVAATPTKSPSCTTVTPGMALAAEVSTLVNLAPKAGGRSTAPYSRPGRLWSEAYRCLPVTISRALTLGTLVPATCHFSGGVMQPLSPTTCTQSISDASSPKPTLFPVAPLTTQAFFTSSDCGSTFHL